MNEWIDPKDRMPEEWDRVFIFDGQKVLEDIRFHDGKFCEDMHDSLIPIREKVLMWYPYPKIPKKS